MKTERSNQEPPRKHRGIKTTCGIKEVLLKEWKLKLLFSFCATLIFCTLYPLTGRFPLFSVTSVPLFSPDRIIPFIPQSVYIYESIWIFNATVIVLLVSKKEILKYAAGIASVFCVCFLFFIFLPMSITRPEYIENSCRLYKILRQFDSPLNTFPSMHVALVIYNCLWFFSLYYVRRVRLPLLIGISIWGVAIIASTLTLKQHVVIDVVSGFVVAYFAFIIQKQSWNFHKFIKPFLFRDLMENINIEDTLYAVNNICVNFFLIKTSKDKYICFDCGWHTKSTEEALKELQINPDDVIALFLTHHHWDHAGNINLFPNAAIYANNSVELSSKIDDKKLNSITDNEKTVIDNLTVTALAVPGHTSDSMAYLVNDKFLFTGDAARIRKGEIIPFYQIFNRDNRKAAESLQKILNLKPETVITPHTGLLH